MSWCRVVLLSSLLTIVPTTTMAQHNVLTPAEVAAGYELLFNGTAVSSAGSGIDWVTYADGNETNTGIEAGWKTFPTDSAFGKDAQPRDIRSKKKYKDFTLSFDFWANGNAGVYYRTLVKGQFGWQTGVEFAIENNTTLAPWILSGAAYELISPPAPRNYRTANWNSAKIIAIGDSVEHWLNGVRIVSYKYWDAQWQAAMSGQTPGLNGQRSKWNNFTHFCRPTDRATTGFIPEGYLGIQGDHAGIVKFRNFKVAPLTQWPGTVVSIADSHDRNADAKAMLLSRIGWSDQGQGATLKFDFSSPYEATVRDISGRALIPSFKAAESGTLFLDRATFRPGVYFIKVKTVGLTLSKTVTLR